MNNAIERLTCWRDGWDGPVTYTAGDDDFASDVMILLDINADLLAALESFVQWNDTSSSKARFDAAIVAASAAIAKAKGNKT